MKNKLDIGAALNVHLKWEAELEALVRGEIMTETLQSHTDCALGIWLHSSGKKKYGHYSETAKLIKNHKKFHVEAENVVERLKTQKKGTAEKSLGKIRNLSREIVFLLSMIELHSLEEEKNLSYPFREFVIRVFYDSHSASSNEKILDISHARLLHLRWAESLSEKFRGWGRKAVIEPADSCALGVWINSVGLKKHQNIPKMKELDLVHRAFHKQALATIKALSSKKHSLADNFYGEVLELSKDIIYLLSQIEVQLSGANTFKQTTNTLE